MMDLLLATSGGESQSASGGYVDDVFSAYLYTGNGSTQTINNGIDLAGKGGLVWLKARSTAGYNHLGDTVRGGNKWLYSDLTLSQDTVAYIPSFLSNGFGLSSSAAINSSGTTYVSWTFRRAPKFFDIVTYTGDGVAGRQIAHSLGVQAGFVTVKSTSTTGDWNSYHRSATGDLKLNLIDAQTASRAIITAADANSFTVSGAANTNGVSYVAYLWAHDPSAEGIIQCGSFVGNVTIPNSVTLGWEPQYVMIKNAPSSGAWLIFDTQRGMPVGSADQHLTANTSDAETITASDYIYPTATGFSLNTNAAEINYSGSTFIYLAIRRPNKPPTSGTQVYNASTASGVVSAGFPVDLHIGATRTGAASNHAMHARLTGGTKELVTSSTAAEATITDLGFDSMTGLRASLPAGGVNHFFRRAPGFFDVVVNDKIGTETHNLGVAPELVIAKSRTDGVGKWMVAFNNGGSVGALSLNTSAAAYTHAASFASNFTATTYNATYVTNDSGGQASGGSVVTYLFATKPGISKIGSYTGNGTSQTINCGFATGARLILIKRTDATGDWYVWDSVRGIIAANDPHLSLNTTAAEVATDDSVDPEASGFIVNQNTATNINVNGGQYIFLAIA